MLIRSSWRTTLVAAALTLACAELGCSSADEPGVSTSLVPLMFEPDCEAVEDFIRQRAMNQYLAQGDLTAPAEPQLFELHGSDATHGQTSVSTDSATYALADGQVVALDSDGNVVRSIPVPGRSELLIAHGSVVLVVGRSVGVLPWRGRGPDEDGVPCEVLGEAGDGRGSFGADSELRSLRGPVTRVTVVDMATGVVYRTLAFEGEFRAARRAGNVVTIVSDGELYFPPADGYVDADDYWTAVTQQFLHEWLPRRIDTRGADSLTDQVARCEGHYVPTDVAGGGFIVGLAIDLDVPAGASINHVGLGLGHVAYAGDAGLYSVYDASTDPAAERMGTILHTFKFTASGLVPSGSISIDGQVSPNGVVEDRGHLFAAVTRDGITSVHVWDTRGDEVQALGDTGVRLTSPTGVARTGGGEILWAGDEVTVTRWDGTSLSVEYTIDPALPAAVAVGAGMVTVSESPAVQVTRWNTLGSAKNTWSGQVPEGASVSLGLSVVTDAEALVPFTCGSGKRGWVALDGGVAKYVEAPATTEDDWCGPMPAAIVLGSALQTVSAQSLEPVPGDASEVWSCQ